MMKVRLGGDDSTDVRFGIDGSLCLRDQAAEETQDGLNGLLKFLLYLQGDISFRSLGSSDIKMK